MKRIVFVQRCPVCGQCVPPDRPRRLDRDGGRPAGRRAGLRVDQLWNLHPPVRRHSDGERPVHAPGPRRAAA